MPCVPCARPVGQAVASRANAGGRGITYTGAGPHGDRRLKRRHTRQAVEDAALDDWDDDAGLDGDEDLDA